MLDLEEIKNSSSIRLQNGHLVLLTHLRSISTDTASIETLGFCQYMLVFYQCICPASFRTFHIFIIIIGMVNRLV